MADNEKLNKPLSYIDWVQTLDAAISSESDLFAKYNAYVTGWYVDKGKAVDNKTYVSELYKDLLREITLNYTTVDERRFLSNIDYDDPRELDIIVPYFATKIKHITQYLVDKRNEVKFAKIRNSLKGSEHGIKIAAKSKIISLLSDNDFVGKYPVSSVAPVSAAARSLFVEIEPLYDVYQHYFDVDPEISGNVYDPKSDAATVLQLFSNTEQRNYNIWLDLTKAIEAIYKEIPVLLATDCTTINSTKGLSIALNVTRNTIADLPLQYFVNGSVSEDDLILNYRKQLIEKYAGTKMVYLSTGNTTTDYVTGDLYNPKHKAANLLNRYHSSHPTVPVTTNLKTVKDIGGYFIPSKLGITNYTSLESYYTLNKSKLKPNTVYVLPDPTVYESGRGSTMTDQPSIYDHHDDVGPVKASRSNTKKYGDIAHDKSIQKFYPYQSREDSLKLQPHGISRYSDKVDFWSGETKDIWSDIDRYPVKPLESLPVSQRVEDLLISDNTVYEWKTDIYGNEYALYKATHPQRRALTAVDNVIQSTDTRTENVTADLFSTPHINYYNYQLSAFNTVYEDRNTDISSTTLFERRDLPQTDVHFRNSQSTVISPLSSALSGVFIKYSNTDILSEINNDIRYFDVIRDYLIVQTSNFIVVEQLHQLTQSSYESKLHKQTYISLSGRNTAFEKFGNWWYHESADELLLCKTVIHPYLSGSNYKIIYPEVYKFNFKDHVLSEVFSLKTLTAPKAVTSLKTSYDTLSTAGLTLSGTGEELNIVSIDSPVISYNELDQTYSLTFLGKGPCMESYMYIIYLDTTNTSSFTVKSATFFRPLNDGYHYHVDNFIGNPTTLEPSISSTLEGQIQRGSVEESFKFSTLGWTSEVDVPGASISAGYVSFGGLTGRALPEIAGTVDDNRNTTHMGQGLSSDNGTTTILNTAIEPYTYNNSYIVSNISLSAAQDISVCLDVALYTNTSDNSAYAMLSNRAPILSSFSGTEQPGDGLCVFFFDSEYDIFPAGVGSALGYTNYTGPLFYDAGSTQYASINGIRGGFIGVGFDVYGHFSNLTDGKTGDTISLYPQASGYPYTGEITCTATQSTSAQRTPNTITVRASELSGYKVLSTTSNLSTYPLSTERYINTPGTTLHQFVSSIEDVTFHKIKVSLQNKCRRVAIDIQNPVDKKFYPYEVVDLDGTNIPKKLRAGVAFSTSHAFMNCEIKNVGIYGIGKDYAKSVSNLAPLTGTAFTVTTTT